MNSIKLFLKALGIAALIVGFVIIGAMLTDNSGSNKAKIKVKIPEFLGDKYKLAMSDEFESDDVNKKIWNMDIGQGFGGENGIQYYSKSGYNLSCDNGILNLTANQNKTGTHHYGSARIQTLSKVQFRYGYIEARIKMQNKSGYTPTFKLLGKGADWTKRKSEKKADGAEIDIMKHPGVSQEVNCGLVWTSGKNKKKKSAMHFNLPNSKNFDVTKWHRYGIFWNDKEIIWYIDGKKACREKLNKTTRNAFRKSFYVVLNTEIEDGTSGTARASSDKMAVDYMRIFQIK